MTSCRWGILATGNIAGAMAEALGHVPGAELLAVASRHQSSADRFATAWSIPRAYEGYGALLRDPDVDVVYIATPNSTHTENVLDALAAGKHVLCEKPLTTSVADTEACLAAARSAGLFLMEAMWTAFFPAMETAQSLIAEGAIGRPRHLRAQFVSFRDREHFPNLFDPALGGGATLDLGTYPITVAQLLVGPIVSHSVEITWGPTGVDEMVAVAARHENGVNSHLSFGFHADLPIEVEVTGERGTLAIPETFHRPDRLVLVRDGASEDLHLPYIGNGYAHEAMHVQNCIVAGKTESEVFPLSASLLTARLLEGLRGRGADGSHSKP